MIHAADAAPHYWEQEGPWTNGRDDNLDNPSWRVDEQQELELLFVLLLIGVKSCSVGLLCSSQAWPCRPVQDLERGQQILILPGSSSPAWGCLAALPLPERLFNLLTRFVGC